MSQGKGDGASGLGIRATPCAEHDDRVTTVDEPVWFDIDVHPFRSEAAENVLEMFQNG